MSPDRPWPLRDKALDDFLRRHHVNEIEWGYAKRPPPQIVVTLRADLGVSITVTMDADAFQLWLELAKASIRRKALPSKIVKVIGPEPAGDDDDIDF